ncbi:ATP/GTP-binding protein [Rhizobacter sp. Root1221]|uniref:AAA family ATPase n=1 Tax=Rhizobacter sp. Root1221 TaxID=1736433 RepID=UPI0006FBDE59|nr:ATP-binding protein [Rhizobacter sp. Root1221]KQW00450.1 hypothetical protein ASC87_18030 [Rhizobacter sp. Root1221]
MLHHYAFKNFQSFAERTEVSLVLNSKVPARGWEAHSPSGERLTTALAVMGANGAGKTAALKPMAFIAWFLANSFHAEPDSRIPLHPHFATPSAPTEIEFQAEDEDGVVWRYVLHATPTHVVHEALYRKQSRFNYVFARDLDASGEGYVVKQQGFGMPPSEAAKVRPNASLISTGRQYNVPMALHLGLMDVLHNVTLQGRAPALGTHMHRAAKLFAENEPLRAQMARLLRSWDFGLSDVVLREVTAAASESKAGSVWMPFGVHETRDGKTHELAFWDESSGTQSAFVLLWRLLSALSGGGVAIIDEADSDLHPHMLEPVLELFTNEVTNPHHAQLIFSTHTTHVLSFLQKSQVLFVEKEVCESSAYRADTIKGLRSDDNLFAKYMAGALGAVPQI